MNRKSGIDTVRAIAALFIVFHHVPLNNAPEVIYKISNILIGWAIYFFFIISGYFLYSENKTDTRIITSMSRFLWIFFVWVILYLPKSIYQYGYEVCLSNYLNFNFLDTGTYHLWFLLALVFGFLIIKLLHTVNIKSLNYIISILIIFYFLLNETYINLFNIEIPYDRTKARFLISIPPILYGFYLAKLKRPQFSVKVSILLIISGFVLSFCEAYFFVGFDSRHYFGTVLVVFGIVNYALSNPKILNSKYSYIGGKYSLGIYLIHPWVIFLWSTFIDKLFFQLNGCLHDILRPFIVFVISLLSFYIIEKISPQVYNIITGKSRVKKGN